MVSYAAAEKPAEGEPMSVRVDAGSAIQEIPTPRPARALAEQALACVDAAITSVNADREAALDDLIAARLLLVTALAVD